MESIAAEVNTEEMAALCETRVSQSFVKKKKGKAEKYLPILSTAG